MRYPTVKTLQNRLGLTRENAAFIREVMEKGDNNATLNSANTVMNGYGVESFGLPDGCFSNCQTPEIDVEYVNMGDTYDTTLMLVNGVFRVGSYGDVVEQFDNAHAV